MGSLITIPLRRPEVSISRVQETVYFIAAENSWLDEAEGRPCAEWRKWGARDEKLDGQIRQYCDGCRALIAGNILHCGRSYTGRRLGRDRSLSEVTHGEVKDCPWIVNWRIPAAPATTQGCEDCGWGIQ